MFFVEDQNRLMHISIDEKTTRVAVKLYEAKPPFNKIKDHFKFTLKKEHYERSMHVSAKIKHIEMSKQVSKQSTLDDLTSIFSQEEGKESFIIVMFTDNEH